jgi:ribokinase
MEKTPQVIVAYSHNVSQATRVHKLPRPGETVRALKASAGMDGAKGTNTAVACARTGASVAMVAHVKGGDWYYKAQQVLKENEIDDTYVILGEGIKDSSGVVLIDDEGNNMIVLGAHNEQEIPDSEIDTALEAMKDASYCVTGYEINEKSVRHILKKARELGMKTVVNPSPIPDFVPDYWNDISILILNEVEIVRMLDLAGVSYEEGNWEDCARKLKEAYGVGDIVVTLGKKGFFCIEGEQIYQASGIEVTSKDTTGAGDGYMGSMTARLAMGDSLAEACLYANRYCSISVQRDGTISSYPTAEEAEEIWRS